MKLDKFSLLAGLFLLSACTQPGAEAQGGGGGTIEAINHTHWAINNFSIDGQSGIDAIGPYDGGGGGCCYGVSGPWRPGMTVRVDWESGEASTKDFPGFEDRVKYKAWLKKMKANDRQHSKVVPVPDYTGQKTCGITVHFMPCDEVKVTTSCATYNSPNYPIKEPLKMPEPKDCPK
ncbi:DUF3304 domain-containing protein [Yersinia sp. Marseille-Q3913]|uniref:DUF3304 domain-containing protein n=1 Tax=Yersinia sp. Marseille-Q3913 TaxID=2830769 RepID=UPI001BAF9DD3|nr:DUF3304 domain-containing protein [Yersinia sp. Marseille-Q3913]MBS0057456.1 DUF3304 domain-containing protein [Yersinia sp. Marseille-Q3913]